MSGETPLSTLQQETEQHRKKQVYIDESGFSETDFRRYAYAPKGVGVDWYKTTTLLLPGFRGVLLRLCFSTVAMRLRSTLGFRRCYVA